MAVKQPKVGVLGATGAVGSTILEVLSEREFPAAEVVALTSKRSAGKKVPFGRRKVLGVVVGLADSSEIADEKLLAPLRALELGVPTDLVALAEWIAAEYCSTIARALGLVLRLPVVARQFPQVPRHPGQHLLVGENGAHAQTADHHHRRSNANARLHHVLQSLKPCGSIAETINVAPRRK